MRGHDRPQATMLTLVNPEQRVPANHPIRLIKALADVVLKELSPLFEQMYSDVGRPSIPPERLLKASLLMALYTVRSERMFCEQFGLQPFVPLVPGYELGRTELRPFDL